MSTFIDDIFRAGGRELIELLNYCVFTIEMDPLFVFLASEYRVMPTSDKALVLYDTFCMRRSVACVSATDVLSPSDFRLERSIQPIRQPLMRIVDPGAEPPRFVPVTLTPGKHLFDSVVQEIRMGPDYGWARVQERFDPDLGALGNLPERRLSNPQRQFVEHQWKPQLRPRLVSAGFRRLANVGEP